MKQIAHIVGWALAIAGCVFFGLTLRRQHEAFASLLEMDGRAIAAFVSSGLLFALIYPLTGWVSARILRDLGTSTSARTLIGVLCVSQLARYVPGNIGQHLARAAMLRARGINTTLVVISLSLETTLALLAAIVLAIIAISRGFAHDSGLHYQSAGVLAIACGLALVLCFAWSDRILPRRMAERLGLHRMRSVQWRTHAICLATYALNYALIGVGLSLLARALGVPLSTPLAIGSFAVAWMAGFLAPGLPAGIGVREAILISMLSPTSGAGAAVVIATLHRLSTVGGDLLAAVAGALLLRRSGPDVATHAITEDR